HSTRSKRCARSRRMAIVADTANCGASMPMDVSMLRSCARMVAWLSTTRTSISWGSSIGRGTGRTLRACHDRRLRQAAQRLKPCSEEMPFFVAGLHRVSAALATKVTTAAPTFAGKPAHTRAAVISAALDLDLGLHLLAQADVQFAQL